MQKYGPSYKKKEKESSNKWRSRQQNINRHPRLGKKIESFIIVIIKWILLFKWVFFVYKN